MIYTLRSRGWHSLNICPPQPHSSITTFFLFLSNVPTDQHQESTASPQVVGNAASHSHHKVDYLSFSSIFKALEDHTHPAFYILWLGLAVASHGGWGLYPVFGRYLQKESHPPLGTLQLLFLISLISMITLGCWTIYDVRRGGEIPFTGIMKPSVPGRPLIDLMPPDGAKWSKATGSLVMLVVLAARALSNMYSVRFTQASRCILALHHFQVAGRVNLKNEKYRDLAPTPLPSFLTSQAHWCQLINMMAPVFVSYVSHQVLKQPLPEHFARTLTLMTAGSVMTVAGGASGGEGRANFTGWDVLGLILSLISAMSLAGEA